MEQLERRDFALSNDPNARATYVKIKRERAKKQMKAIALKNMKGVGESAAEQALHEAGLAGQASKVDGLLGAGWLDISINSYSKEAAEDTQAKRNELGQFIRTLGNIKVGIQSVACMEEMGMTVDDHDIAAFRFYSSMESFEEACKAKDLHPGLHRDRIALINVREG